MRGWFYLPDTPIVYLVDDDAEWCEALSFRLLVSGQASLTFPDAESFLSAHSPEMRGCLLTDLRLPGMDGVGLVTALKHRPNQLPVILISGYADTASVVSAMRAGAVDFLEKPLDMEATIRAIANALQNTHSAASLGHEANLASARVLALSARERAVFNEFAHGTSTKMVAHILSLSPKTVESLRVRLFDKMGVESPSALVRLAVLIAVYGDGSG